VRFRERKRERQREREKEREREREYVFVSAPVHIPILVSLTTNVYFTPPITASVSMLSMFYVSFIPCFTVCFSNFSLTSTLLEQERVGK